MVKEVLLSKQEIPTWANPDGRWGRCLGKGKYFSEFASFPALYILRNDFYQFTFFLVVTGRSPILPTSSA